MESPEKIGTIKGENIIKEYGKLKINSLLEKKKHYNAADRKECYNICLSISIIILNLILGSYFLGLMVSSTYLPLIWISALLALIAVILASIQLYCNFGEKVELHRNIGNDYNDIVKRTSLELSKFLDGFIDISTFYENFENLMDEYKRLNEKAIKCPTNNSDYKKACQGIENEEEDYSEKEKKLMGID
jgi:hypothetical protein